MGQIPLSGFTNQRSNMKNTTDILTALEASNLIKKQFECVTDSVIIRGRGVTIGWGHYLSDLDQGNLQLPITKRQAEAILLHDCISATASIRTAINADYVWYRLDHAERAKLAASAFQQSREEVRKLAAAFIEHHNGQIEQGEK